MYSLAIPKQYSLSSGCISNNIYMTNDNLCTISIYYQLYNDIWYIVNNLKHTKSILAQVFHYLLFYMKPETISILFLLLKIFY